MRAKNNSIGYTCRASTVFNILGIAKYCTLESYEPMKQG